MNCVCTFQGFRLQNWRLTATNQRIIRNINYPLKTSLHTKLWKWVWLGMAFLAIFAFFLSSLGGFSLTETFVFAERSYSFLLSIAPSHNFWWSPPHRWGNHKSSVSIATQVKYIGQLWQIYCAIWQIYSAIGRIYSAAGTLQCCTNSGVLHSLSWNNFETGGGWG